MRFAWPTPRRLLMTGACLVVALVLVSSCTLDADVSTDTGGRVTGIHALQIRSGTLDLALALALEGRQLVIELRWRPERAGSALLF